MKENLFKDFYNRGFLEDKKNNVSVNGLKMLFDFLEELIEGKIKLDDELNEFEVMAKAVKEDELILKIKNYYENRGNDYNILKQESLKIIQSSLILCTYVALALVIILPVILSITLAFNMILPICLE